MPIQFSCPHCGVYTEVADEFAGLKGPCAACLNTIEIPPLPKEEPAAVEPARRAGKWIVIALVLVISAVLIGAAVVVSQVGPTMLRAKLTMQEEQCKGNLGEIALGLKAYHARYDAYPPAVVYSSDGRPMHSWRVLILPFVGEDDLYDEYDFSQAWNGPKNRKLHERMPAIFGCPNDPASFKGHTSYLAVVGPETAWPTEGQVRLRERPKSVEQKILLVEAADSGVVWLQPQDLRIDLMNKKVNDYSSAGVGSFHLKGAHVVLLDGTVQRVDEKTTEKELVDLLTLGPPPKAKKEEKKEAEKKDGEEKDEPSAEAEKPADDEDKPAEEKPQDDKPVDKKPAEEKAPSEPTPPADEPPPAENPPAEEPPSGTEPPANEAPSEAPTPPAGDAPSPPPQA